MEAIKEIQTRKTYKRIFHRDVEGVTVAVVEDYLRPIREIQNSCKEEYAAISVVLDSYRHIPFKECVIAHWSSVFARRI